MRAGEETFLVFCRPGGGRIKVCAEVLQVMTSYAQHRHSDTEAGGVLLGRYLLGCEDIVIDAITVPLPGDRRSRYSFYRAKQAHQASIDAVWKASGGICTYLGEWHTHPEEHPTPSCIDLKDWRRRLRQDQYYDELLFLIVGTATTRAWAGKGIELSTTPLQLFTPTG